MNSKLALALALCTSVSTLSFSKERSIKLCPVTGQLSKYKTVGSSNNRIDLKTTLNSPIVLTVSRDNQPVQLTAEYSLQTGAGNSRGSALVNESYVSSAIDDHLLNTDYETTNRERYTSYSLPISYLDTMISELLIGKGIQNRKCEINGNLYGIVKKALYPSSYKTNNQPNQKKIVKNTKKTQELQCDYLKLQNPDSFNSGNLQVTSEGFESLLVLRNSKSKNIELVAILKKDSPRLDRTDVYKVVGNDVTTCKTLKQEREDQRNVNIANAIDSASKRVKKSQKVKDKEPRESSEKSAIQKALNSKTVIKATNEAISKNFKRFSKDRCQQLHEELKDNLLKLTNNPQIRTVEKLTGSHSAGQNVNLEKILPVIIDQAAELNRSLGYCQEFGYTIKTATSQTERLLHKDFVKLLKTIDLPSKHAGN